MATWKPLAANSRAQLALMPGPPPTMSATSRSPDCVMARAPLWRLRARWAPSRPATNKKYLSQRPDHFMRRRLDHLDDTRHQYHRQPTAQGAADGPPDRVPLRLPQPV